MAFLAIESPSFSHNIHCKLIHPPTHSYSHLSPVTSSIALPAWSPGTPLPAGLESLQHVQSLPQGLSPVGHAWYISWGRHLGDILSKWLNHLHWTHFAMFVCSRCQVRLCTHWEHFFRGPNTLTHCIYYREQTVENFMVCIGFVAQGRGSLKQFQLGKRCSIVVQQQRQSWPVLSLPPYV